MNIIFYPRNVRTSLKSTQTLGVLFYFGDSNMGAPALESELTDFATFEANYTGEKDVLVYWFANRDTSDDGSLENYSNRPPLGNYVPGNTSRLAGPPYSLAGDPSLVGNLEARAQKTMLFKMHRGGSRLAGGTADFSWLYQNLFNIVQEKWRYARRDIYNAGYNRIIPLGAIVRLGTNDCATANWNRAAFQAELQTFCGNLKAIFIGSNKPIWWYQVRTDLGGATGWGPTNVSEVRTDINNCGPGGSTEIDNFVVVDSSGYAVQSDLVHNTADAFVLAGEDDADRVIAANP